MSEPVGEDSWVALVDEASRTAGDIGQRVDVVELYKRGLDEEPYSLRLWLAYCEWFWSLYTDCQSSDAGWPEEEQLLGRELFTLEAALDVWQQGAWATRYRLDDSQVLWNRWILIEQEELSKKPDEQGIERVRTLFMNRLQVPHSTWDDTSQMFSTFITKYDEPSWEKTMVETTQLAKRAKELYSQREMHELKLQNAIKAEDKEAQRVALNEYLEWELIQSRKKSGDLSLCFALYERALLILGTDATLWEDYADFVGSFVRHFNTGKGEKAAQDAAETPNLLRLLQRATKHCPWSGSVWSRYMLKAEMEGLPFSEIEQIKHAATRTGQLDRDGMKDVLAVYSTWCGYLRRRAVRNDATDEDIDIADVGLPSALESVQEWGESLYGKEVYKGDPSFQLERCLIQYLAQRGSVDEARSQWQKLVKTHGDSYEFWQRYYFWEMTVDRADPRRPLAMAVLKQAVSRKGLDWPEKIMENYIQHCESYGDAQSLVAAIDIVHKSMKGVAKRRSREAIEAAVAYAAQGQPQQDPAVAEPITDPSPLVTSKRKRDSISQIDENAAKKIKENDSGSEHLKRDREHTTLLVTNLPKDVTQTKVRQYFKGYGHIINLAMQTESDGLTTAALVEFKSTEDIQSAMLRDGRYLGDRQIHVESGLGLTLYVTNYPPSADEAYIRDIFKDCGEIFSIRWPSLKYNTHRRFCYVSFRHAEGAAAATELDGKLIEGQYKLSAKYSDPGRRKQREGALAEGREVHVTNIDRTATEDELREIFSKYGSVESVRILKNIAGKSRGSGFIVFEKKENAEDALVLDKTKFKSEILGVQLANQTNYKPIATSGSMRAFSTSASPVPGLEGDALMPNSPSTNSHATENRMLQGSTKTEVAARTTVVMNVPDTVNDTRIRAIAEPYGSIAKLTLRPDHQGAIIEYADVAAAGRASLGLEGHEIIPGRKLRTGTLSELFKQKGEIRTDKIQSGSSAKKPSPAGQAFMQPSGPIRRPGPGIRGGLGAKRGLGHLASAKKAAATVATNGTAGGGGEPKAAPKSNADFKAMFLKSGSQEKE
jgi:squamous cell carcinoma antigen recognized by T-cells 3